MKIKFGIVGTNFISDNFIDALSKTSAECNAVYSRTFERGHEFADKHAIRNVYTDYDNFLHSGINAVYIATPNCMHAGQSIAALNAGLHVLCEKPIASNIGEFAAMKKASVENNRVLLEAMRPAFDPALKCISDNMSKIGKIRRAVIDFSQYSSRYDSFKSGKTLNAFNPALSNAAVMDIGVYCIYVCCRLFGKPEKIISDSVFLENGFEGAGTALFKYNGFNAEIQYSKISESYLPSYIQGENGTLIFKKPSCPHEISIHYRDGSSENVKAPFASNNMIYEIEEFMRLVDSSCIEHMYHETSEIVLASIDAIRSQNNIIFPADVRN